MSQPLDRGLAALQELLGGGTPEELVERVVAQAKCELIYFVGQGPNSRWFRFAGDELTELFPRQERKLPLLTGMTEETRASAEIISWRPSRRVILLDSTGQQPTVLKGYRRGRGGAAKANLERLVVPDTAPDDLAFPELLEFMPDVDALRMAFIEGGPLQITTADMDVFDRIGRGLARMQAVVSTAGLPEHGAAEELRNLDKMAERVQAVTELDASWAESRERLSALSCELAAPASVVVHRDLHDGQFIVGADSIGLLDFDLMAQGDPLLDLANLSAHLQLRAMQVRSGANQEGADVCTRALVAGFGLSREPAGLQRFLFYQATTYTRLALVYTLRPRWRHLAGPLTTLAKRCNDENSRV